MSEREKADTPSRDEDPGATPVIPVVPEPTEDIEARVEDLEAERTAELGHSSTAASEIAIEITSDDPHRTATENFVNAQIETGELKGIETISDLRQLSAEKLLNLESQYEGLLFYAFTDFMDGGTELNFEHWYDWYKEPQDGAQFKISFRGNTDAYWNIGAGHILPPSVRNIEVWPKGIEANKRASKYRLGLKSQRKDETAGFFDSNDDYIPVFDNDVITIRNVKEKFDKKYRKEPAKEGRLGELDYTTYQKSNHARKDKKRTKRVQRQEAATNFQGNERISSSHASLLNLGDTEKFWKSSKESYGKRLDSMIHEFPDLLFYANKYREKYAAEFKVDVPESIVFGMFLRESGFDAGTMNKAGSDCGGLGQFWGPTWTDFINANPWVTEKMQQDPVWQNRGVMDWRFNPEIMMAATFWYSAKNIRDTYNDHQANPYTYDRFLETSVAKSKGGIISLAPEDAWLVYLNHHDGHDGASRQLRYKSYREDKSDWSQSKAARKAGLTSTQQATRKKGYTPERYFNKYGGQGKESVVIGGETEYWADERFDWITGVDDDCGLNEKISHNASTFHNSLFDETGGRRIPVPTESKNWGWAKPDAAAEIARIEAREASREATTGLPSYEYYRDAETLDALAENPVVPGNTLYIGSSSTNGSYGPRMRGDKKILAADSRKIINRGLEGEDPIDMVSSLEALPVEELKTFDRVVLQGGVKNAWYTDPQKRFGESRDAMIRMVEHIQEHSPDTKIYVIELTPWGGNYKATEAFNNWLNTEGESIGITVVPCYQIMTDGTRKGIVPEYGYDKKKVHITHGNRYAGMLADWIRRSEQPPSRASSTRLIGDSLFSQYIDDHLKLDGQNIPHSTEATYVQGGKSIAVMRQDLEAAVEANEFEGVKSVAIWAGANNIVYSDVQANVLTPYQEMIDLLKGVNPDMRIVLVTIPPVTGYHDPDTGEPKWSDPEGTNEHAILVNDWIRSQAAANPNISYVDAYAMIQDPAREGYMQTNYDGGDSLHLSTAGYQLVQTEIERQLSSNEVAMAAPARPVSTSNIDSVLVIPKSSDRGGEGTATTPRNFLVLNDQVANGGAIGMTRKKKDEEVQVYSEFVTSQVEHLASQDYTCIVDFGQNAVPSEGVAAEANGIDYYKKTVYTSPTPGSHNQEIIQLISDLIDDDEKIYVHCTNGAHRAPGIMTMVYLHRNPNLTFEQAFAKAGGKYSSYNKAQPWGWELFQQMVNYAEARDVEVSEETYAFVQREHGENMRA